MLLYESESDDSLSVAEDHNAKFHLKWSLLGKSSGVGAKPPAGLLTGLTLKQAECTLCVQYANSPFTWKTHITDCICQNKIAE